MIKSCSARICRAAFVGKKLLLQRLLNSNSNANGHTDHGHELARRQWRSQGQAQCVPRSINSRKSVSPKILSGTANGEPIRNLLAGCYNTTTWSEQKVTSAKAEVTIIGEVRLLLQAFLNSNSNANSHTDHGVVTCGVKKQNRNLSYGINSIISSILYFLTCNSINYLLLSHPFALNWCKIWCNDTAFEITGFLSIFLCTTYSMQQKVHRSLRHDPRRYLPLDLGLFDRRFPMCRRYRHGYT